MLCERHLRHQLLTTAIWNAITMTQIGRNLKQIMNIQQYSLLHYVNLLTWYLKRTHAVQKYKNPVRNMQNTTKRIKEINKTSHNVNMVEWP